ncbi:TadE/TadG family type IV pilus assembly protein [Devosia sediminis]|uniref:Pilus assembly protein n=1 Tax=Devosia sediminis TaxID=2798801 RepID=A0A934MN74_9HYPH|nr:TadE/TadG family type IV pilus assembly protein [Devosia sediminis]MBJ3786481.1 pilus assembly protein [Devosia sediminis]
MMRRFLARFTRREDGVSAIEFALFAPIFLLILAAATDFGALIHTRSQLEAALSNATSFAMASGQQMTVDNAASLALNSAKVLIGQAGTDAGASIVVNNGPSATYTEKLYGQSGQAAPAAQCYCPSRDGAAVRWGSPVSCSTPCSNGGFAGKFVALSVTVGYRPLFVDYGLTENGVISLSALARLQ